MAAHPYSFAASLPATPPGPSPRLQVVELQELVDAQLVAAGQGGSPLRKAWRRRCLAQIGMCIQDSFAPLLQQCSQLIAAGENTDRRVTEILGEADTFVAQVGTLCGGGSNEVGAVQHRQGSSLIMLYHCCWHPHPPTHPPARPPTHPRIPSMRRSLPRCTTTCPPASPPTTASLASSARSITASWQA
jgi:hypothetical protein